DFWASRHLLARLDGVRAATLMAHAFNDWNVKPEHSVRAAAALKARGVPVQYYFHQGGHGGEPPFELMNRWFTRYLYGVQNGVERDPRAWIVRENDDRLKPTPYADYPHPDAAPVTLRPTPSGGGPARLNGIGGLVVGGGRALGSGAGAGQVTETLVDNVSFDGAALARAEWSNHRLLYATPPLTEAVHISGTPRVTIRLASSKPAANLSVGLVALPRTGGPRPPGRPDPPRPGRPAAPRAAPRRRAAGPRPLLRRDVRPPARRPGDPRGPAHRPHDLLERPRLHALADARHGADGRPRRHVARA